MSSVINEKVSMDNYIYNVEGYSVNWTNMMDDLFDSSSIYNEYLEDDSDLLSKLSCHLTEMKRAPDSIPPIPRILPNESIPPIPDTAQILKTKFRFTKKTKQPYNRKTKHANKVRSN
jgi:hypothetical protein